MLRTTRYLARAVPAEYVAETKKAVHQIPGPPQWPILGSLPDFLKVGPEMHKVHSAYYDSYAKTNSQGPIVRQNLAGTTEIIVYDPREYLKVYQNEGVYPTGFTGDLWMQDHLVKELEPYFKERGEFFTVPFAAMQGEAWATRRQEIQKDIMSPKVAASYVWAFNNTCRLASARIEALASEENRRVAIKDITANIAFDLFCSASFGRSLNTVDPANADPKDLQFVQDSIRMLQLTIALMMKPHAKFLPTAEYTEYIETSKRAWGRGRELVAQFVEDVRSGRLTFQDAEAPILYRMLKRGIDEDVVVAEFGGLLGAATDTTQHVLLWLFLNLATNQEAQDKLAAELKTVLQGGDYAKGAKENLVYMKAVIRESHRRNHPNPLLTMRRLQQDICLNGYHIPKDTRISFSAAAIQMDPAYVDEPEKFLPERFLPDAIKARKDDPVKSVLDHRLLSTPFSAGARMCPGGRLAENEIWALLARLVQDFRITLDPPEQTWEVKMPFMTVATPYPTLKFERRE